MTRRGEDDDAPAIPWDKLVDHYAEDPTAAWDVIDQLLIQTEGLDDDSPVQTYEVESFEERRNEIQLKGEGQTVALRRHLVYGAFGAVALQLVAANVAFYLYGIERRWDIESEVMIAWLTATVVETLGVVLIIARNLFPNGEPDG